MRPALAIVGILLPGGGAALSAPSSTVLWLQRYVSPVEANFASLSETHLVAPAFVDQMARWVHAVILEHGDRSARRSPTARGRHAAAAEMHPSFTGAWLSAGGTPRGYGARLPGTSPSVGESANAAATGPWWSSGWGVSTRR